MTLTLSGRNYVSSSWDISRALTITGIDGVTKDSVRRISDTEATVELEFNGDFEPMPHSRSPWGQMLSQDTAVPHSLHKSLSPEEKNR